MQFKQLEIEDALFLKNKFDITLKRDGTQIEWKNGCLLSKRDLVRNDRFPHIVKLLKDNKFPDCVGEMYIQKGNVFDVSRSENWCRALFMPFDLYMNKPLEQRQELIDKLINKIKSKSITKPIRFDSIKEGWDYVKKNNGEGLVLKGESGWFKIKILQESKVEVAKWEKGNTKGTFILKDNNRISGTSVDFVNQFLEWKKQGKKVMAECEYAFLTDSKKMFQPRLRRLFLKKTNLKIFNPLKLETD